MRVVRAVFQLFFAVVVASRDASSIIDHMSKVANTILDEGIEDEVGKAAEEAVGSLLISEAAKALAYASVMEVSTKFERLLVSIENLVAKDRALVDKVSKFANAFRPVQLAAHELVVDMERLAYSLSRDMLPSLKDAWEDEAYGEMTDAIGEIQEAVEEQLLPFDLVGLKYRELAVEANVLANEAFQHSHELRSMVQGCKATGGVAVALVAGGGGAIASSVFLAPIALAYLAAAGFSVVAGGAGAIVSYSQHQFGSEIMESALVLSSVMMEINKLMNSQSKNLIAIKAQSKDLVKHSKKINEQAQVCKSSSEPRHRPKRKVDRLLAMLTETSAALVEQCQTYQKTDTAGQQAVWEKLQQQATKACSVENRCQALEP